MLKKSFKFRPVSLYLIIMIIELVGLLILLIPVFNATIFLFYLLIIFSFSLRWRFLIHVSFMVIDLVLFIILSQLYPSISIFLYLFAYYFSYKGKSYYTLPIIIIGLINKSDSLYYTLIIQATLLGTILYFWDKESFTYHDNNDHLRKKLYELELIQSRLLSDYQDTEKLSRLAERQRIAEILHDDLGHELTATDLSLKACKTLINANKYDQADISLNLAMERLGNALTKLKDSVRTIEPNLEIGIDNLKSIIDNFIYPINFNYSGDLLRIQPYVKQLIQIAIREALTNIAKHAIPKIINIDLEVTDIIVRLVILNDGIKNKRNHSLGNGLRYMRNRIEAVNGSLSIQSNDTFKIIIIIPLNDGR